jgi:hypothetical protein
LTQRVAINSSGGFHAYGNVTFPQLVSCDTIDTDASGNLKCGTDATGGGGGGFGNVTGSNLASSFVPYATNSTNIAASPMTYSSSLGFNLTGSNLSLGTGGRIFLGPEQCAEFGSCPYLANSPSWKERLYFYSSDFIEFEADGLLLPRQYNEFRMYDATIAGVNITNSFTGKGNLYVQNDTYVYNSLYVGNGQNGAAGDCITFNSGGKVCSNSTTTWILSPDGGTKLEAEN